jgi:hypothetical protein
MAVGLWGLASIAIDKENCALYYLSPTCYKFIYCTDPVSLCFLRCWLYDVILIRLLRPGMVGAAERAMKLEGIFGVS